MTSINYIRNIEELQGWIMAKIVLFDNAELMIKLTDDSIAIFDIDYGHYDDDPKLQLSGGAELDEYQLYSLGFMTKTEYDKFQSAQKEELSTKWEQQRRRQYEALRKEFDNG